MRTAAIPQVQIFHQEWACPLPNSPGKPTDRMGIPGMTGWDHLIAIRIPKETPETRPLLQPSLQIKWWHLWLPLVVQTVEGKPLHIEINIRSFQKRFGVSRQETVSLIETRDLWRLACLIGACKGSISTARKVDALVRRTRFDPPSFLSIQEHPELLCNIDCFQQEGRRYINLLVGPQLGKGAFKTAEKVLMLELDEPMQTYLAPYPLARLEMPLNDSHDRLLAWRYLSFCRLFKNRRGVIQLERDFRLQPQEGPKKQIFLHPLYQTSLCHLVSFHKIRELSQDARCRIIADCLHGLCAIHARHVIHRDLRSPNILLRFDGAVISDFDLACFEGEAAFESQVCLDPHWAPPESYPLTQEIVNASGNKEVVARTYTPEEARKLNTLAIDTFALGVNFRRLMPRDQRSAAIQQIFDRMCAENPSDRPPAEELLRMWTALTPDQLLPPHQPLPSDAYEALI